jgi:hypothetical protein
MRKFALFDVFHPGAIHSQRHLMLFLTGHTASVTANTLAVVNEKPEFHGIPLSVLRSPSSSLHAGPFFLPRNAPKYNTRDDQDLTPWLESLSYSQSAYEPGTLGRYPATLAGAAHIVPERGGDAHGTATETHG